MNSVRLDSEIPSTIVHEVLSNREAHVKKRKSNKKDITCLRAKGSQYRELTEALDNLLDKKPKVRYNDRKMFGQAVTNVTQSARGRNLTGTQIKLNTPAF